MLILMSSSGVNFYSGLTAADLYRYIIAKIFVLALFIGTASGHFSSIFPFFFQFSGKGSWKLKQTWGIISTEELLVYQKPLDFLCAAKVCQNLNEEKEGVKFATLQIVFHRIAPFFRIIVWLRTCVWLFRLFAEIHFCRINFSKFDICNLQFWFFNFKIVWTSAVGNSSHAQNASSETNVVLEAVKVKVGFSKAVKVDTDIQSVLFGCLSQIIIWLELMDLLSQCDKSVAMKISQDWFLSSHLDLTRPWLWLERLEIHSTAGIG